MSLELFRDSKKPSGLKSALFPMQEKSPKKEKIIAVARICFIALLLLFHAKIVILSFAACVC
jgi:hypothetical protein